MLLNLVLLFLVFGAEKKKFSPYLAAALLGLLKGALNLLGTRNFVFAALMGVVFGCMATGFVFFLRRVERRENAERPDVPTYGVAGSEKIRFKWEYLPLIALLLLIVGGEFILALLGPL